ncbi:MAG: nucleotidyltransferase domain-containing protein [Nanoarchaeota archaeon]|nr:nucleotidyltransferase domain-containing protein [Nanoarchaeota archaeon]
MISHTQLDILSSFFPELKEKTSREIELATGLSHEPVFRTLKSLVKDRYLKERKVGKTNVYEFIFTDESYFVYTFFMMKRINKFKEKRSLVYKRLKEFADSIKASSVILFGSYAKGTETKESDIDVLAVSDDGSAEKAASILKTKYDITIKPAVTGIKDFRNIKSDNPEFYKDLVEFGIVIDGMEFFFKEVYSNAKAN